MRLCTCLCVSLSCWWAKGLIQFDCFNESRTFSDFCCCSAFFIKLGTEIFGGCVCRLQWRCQISLGRFLCVIGRLFRTFLAKHWLDISLRDILCIQFAHESCSGNHCARIIRRSQLFLTDWHFCGSQCYTVRYNHSTKDVSYGIRPCFSRKIVHIIVDKFDPQQKIYDWAADVVWLSADELLTDTNLEKRRMHEMYWLILCLTGAGATSKDHGIVFLLLNKTNLDHIWSFFCIFRRGDWVHYRRICPNYQILSVCNAREQYHN